MATEAPTQVIADILSWLPVKTLLRFKTVSKSWYNLISDPWFVDLHRQRSKRNLNVLYINCKEEGNISGQRRTTLTFTCTDCEWNISEVFTRTLEGCGRFHYFGCVSGYDDLICFVASNWGGCEHIYLYNPVSHQVFALPERNSLLDFPHSTIGLGYVCSTREYKVLRMFTDYEYLDIKCEILTFCPGRDGSNPCCSWRATSENFPCSGRYSEDPVFVHEYFHWIIWGNSYPSSGVEVFDLRTEKFSMIPLPSKFNNCPIPQNNCPICGDSLHLLVDDFQDKLNLAEYHSPVFVSLWVLEDYDKHIWKRTYDIDFSPIMYHRQPNYYLICRIMANGELLILGRDLQPKYPYSHYFYNVKSHSFRSVQAPREQICEFDWSLGFYWESLVAL